MDSIYKRMTEPEREVADYFKRIGLRWKFEFPVFVFDEHERPRIFIPDFYIQKLGVFIEVCGSEKFDYNRRKKVYEENGVSVVFLHYYKHPTKWKSFLAGRITEIEQQRQTEACKLTVGFSSSH